MKIRNKFLINILAIVFIVLVSLSYLSYASSRRALVSEIKQKAENMLEAKAEELSAILDGIHDVAEGLAHSIEAHNPDSEKVVRNLIVKFLESEPNAYGSTVSFMPGLFSGAELVGPYYHRGESGLVYVDLATSTYNYPKWDWFKKPAETGKPFWTEPYADVGGGDVPMTTYATPFFKDGGVWGVATVDVALTALTGMVEKIKPSESGFSFLVSKEGKFLSMRKNEWRLTRTIFDVADEYKIPAIAELGKKMLSQEAGIFYFDDTPILGESAWVAYGPVPITGWSLAIVFPEDEIMAPLAALHHRMIMIAIAGILLVSGVIFLVSTRIAAPIGKLSLAAGRMAVGDFSSPLKIKASRDEVGALAAAFGSMRDSLSRMVSELAGEKEMFKVAFANMSDGVVIMDPKFNVIESNKVAQRLLMLPARSSFAEHLVTKFDSDTIFSSMGGELEKELKFKLTRKETENAGALHLACLLTPVLDESRKVKEFMFAARDITETESEERSKRNFLSLISHKLFTPLTVLEGKILLLKDGLLGGMNEKQKKDVDSIAVQTEKLKSLIEGLVNFVTLEGEKLETSRDDIELSQFLGDIAKEYESRFAEKRARVSVSAAPGAGKFLFNSKYLKMVVGQLIENGLKFNMSDPAEIEVTCKRESDRVVISVKDNGIGIPPEFLDRIFDKFYQIDRYFTGNVEGVGLGLSYVKKIAQNFGGGVQVISEPGKGSTFSVTLPKTASS